MNIQEWSCPKCKRTIASIHRTYKCVCGYEPPIEDYKEAFKDLMEEYDEHKKDAALGYMNVSNACDMYKKEAAIFKIVSVVLSIGIIALLLIK